jgi:hypothetical protein
MIFDAYAISKLSKMPPKFIQMQGDVVLNQNLPHVSLI